MRAISRVAAVAVVLTGSMMARAQAPAATPTGAATGVPKPGETPKAATVPVGELRKLTEKQKALAIQADRLVNMANELKEQVDKTDKNILSLKVVEKAQEIEALAKGMKEQAKKGQ